MRQPPQTPRKPPRKPPLPPRNAPPPPPPTRPKGHNDFVRYATQQAKRNGVPTKFFISMITQESNFNPNAVSPKGAQGIGQFMPATWAALTRRYGMQGASPLDPKAALKVMARYVGSLIKQYGNLYDPLSVYNSGKPWSEGQNIPETNRYVQAVLSGATDYVHPLPGVPQGRTDEGVDFRPGKGQPILSIGNAVVDFIGSYQGFGTYMAYKLLDGPAKGREIYVSESISPVVKKGQRVKAGQPVAVATGASKGIEMGFAQSSGTYLPVANPTYNEGDVTSAGQAFSGFLSNLQSGVPGFSASAGIGDGGAGAGTPSPPASAPITGGAQVLASTSASDFGALSAAESTVPGILSPGAISAEAPGPQEQASTWQLLASQPLVDSETQALYRRVQMAGG